MLGMRGSTKQVVKCLLEIFSGILTPEEWVENTNQSDRVEVAHYIQVVPVEFLLRAAA